MSDYQKMKEVLSKLEASYISFEDADQEKSITINFVYGYAITFLFDSDGKLIAEVNNVG